ncbi:YfiR family protein [Oxalobacteraceae bacterium OTU3CINTB1]|nr:YfiR family protein [Oxalobacteraceae bacterium OTU3CINTB1]
MLGKMRAAKWMRAAAALTLAMAMAKSAAAQARIDDGAEKTDIAEMFTLTALAAFSDSAASATLQDQLYAASPTSVKAGFLYKFLGYVDFPAGPLDPGTPYVVGVVGADGIAAELTRLTAGRLVNNHAVVVRKMQGHDPSGGLHLLFIGADEGADEAALVKAAQPAGVLTVTESATGIESGSVINFKLVDERVRFEVSLAAADKGRLKLSSRLLSVAYAVQKGGG